VIADNDRPATFAGHFTAALVLCLVLTATQASAQESEKSFLSKDQGLLVGPSPEYEEVVKLYTAGQFDAAVAEIGAWTQLQLAIYIGSLRDVLKHSPVSQAGKIFSGFPVRAALLLHTDREILDQIRRPESEQPPVCGIGSHSYVIEMLSRILLILDPKDNVFVRRVYLALSRHARWSHCVETARQWAIKGLAVLPKDADLLTALGIALESRAFFTRAPAPRSGDSLVGGNRKLWDEARRAFEAALAANPDSNEARLRLGRVLWRFGEFDSSLPLFETVLGKSTDPSLRYLAHLFLGRVLEDKGDLTLAEKHYRSAREIEPLSITTAVALSVARFLDGDLESARGVLLEGMDAVRRRSTHDPWGAYEVNQTPDGEILLADLRRLVRK
jgi:tetratricopeptide (TPR) repeat protein